MLCEGPKRDVEQMDKMSCFNGLETTGVYTVYPTCETQNTQCDRHR